MTNNDLTLRFVSADRLGQMVRLPQRKCSIGAGENCTLRLAGQGLRPVHCFILRGPGGTVVRRWSPDTRLNGLPFRDAALHTGDRLSVGPVELEVVDGPPASPSIEVSARLARDLAARDLELEQLRQQLCQAREQTDAGEAQRRSLADKLADSHERQQGEEQRFDEQLKTFGQLQGEWHGERDSLVVRCEHLQVEFDAALAREEAANRERQAAAEAWWAEQNAAAQEKAVAQENLARATADLERLQSELQFAQRNFAEQTAELARQRESWEAESARRQSEAAQREAELDQLAGALRLQQTELTQEAERLNQARASIDAERADLQLSQQQAGERQDARLRELAHREAELAQQRADMQSQAAALAAERELLQANDSSLHAKLAILQTELDQTATALHQQRSEIDAKELTWRDERQALATQLEEQCSKFDAQQLAWDEERRSLATWLDEQRSEYDSKLHSSQQQLHTLTEQLDAQRAEFGAERHSWQLDRDALAVQLNEKTLALDAEQQLRREERQGLTTQLENQRAAFDELQLTWQEERGTLTTQMEQQRSEFDAEQIAWQEERHELATQLDVERVELDALQIAWRKERDTLAAHLDERSRRFDEEQLSWQQERHTLTTQLAEERIEFNAEQLSCQEERHAFAVQLDQQQMLVASLQQKLAELRSERDALLAAMPESTAADNNAAFAEETIAETANIATPETAAPRAAPSEAMLALQRLREAARNGNEVPETASEAPAIGDADETERPEHAAADESEVSIEDYMSQLMQRVRGKADETVLTPNRRTAFVPAKPDGAAAATAANESGASGELGDRVKTEAPCHPLRSLPARTAAPEQPGSLQAMRELANQSARTALDANARTHWVNSVRAKFAVSMASGACGGVLFSFNAGLFSWATLAAVGSLAIAGVFGWQGWRMSRQRRTANSNCDGSKKLSA